VVRPPSPCDGITPQTQQSVLPLAGLYIYGSYSQENTSLLKMFGFVYRKPNIFITFAVEI